MSKYRILVVEDEANILSFMETILETNGYQVLTAMTCAEGKLLFSSHYPELVVLDLGLPDMDGLEFIRAVRKNANTPILVLSARTAEQDKISALDLGANDYITKPFGTGELLARVRAALRNRRPGFGAGDQERAKFIVKDLEIRYDRRTVYIGKEEVKLTQTEYNIVALLSAHAGKMLTYAAIIREIWGDVDPGSIKKLQVNMANIRKKIGARPGDQKYILNELGVGYRMLEQDE